MRCILDNTPKHERERLVQSMLDSAMAESGTDQYKYVLAVHKRMDPFIVRAPSIAENIVGRDDAGFEVEDKE